MFSFVHDVNGDGLSDIIVLGRVQKHPAVWYENPGLGDSEPTRREVISAGAPLDATPRQSESAPIASEAPSKSRYWKSHFLFERIRGESPTLVDIDGDGAKEWICHWEGCWGWIAPQQSDPYAPWELHAIGEDEGWLQFYHGEGVGDVNGHGRLDLLMNDGWQEQPPHSNSEDVRWRFHRHRFASGRGGAQMFVDDVDRDSDPDVISAIDAHGWGLAWYE